LDPHQLTLNLSCDPGFAGGGEHVYFAADAELREIDAGLDGEAGVRQQAALVVGFKIVEVRAGAVNLMDDIVAGAMGEVLAESGGADDGAGGIVGFESANGAVGGEGLLDSGDGGVAGVADGFEDELLFGAGLAADDAGPGDVVVDGFWRVDTRPDVDEEEVAFADGGGVVGGGLVVGVRTVGIDADVGAVFPDETSAAHGFAEPLDVVELGVGCGAALRRAEAASDLLPSFGEEGVDGLLCDGMGGDLVGGEDGFELADEVGGADDVLAEGAEEIDGTGIDHGDVHDVVVGRVLHGDLFLVLEEILDACMQFLPTGVEAFGAGERVETALLDAVHQLARVARGGDEVIPAARDVRLLVEAEDTGGYGVSVMMVVK